MIEFKMPALGADMEKGTVVTWHVKPGDTVHKGDVILDVETDKGVIAVDSFESGALQQILVRPGETVPVGTTLAYIAASSQEIPTPSSLEASSLPTESLPVSASYPTLPPAPEKQETEKQETEKQLTETTHRHRASPLARRLAEDLGIDLAQISKVPPVEAIHKKDVEEFAASKAAHLWALPLRETAKGQASKQPSLPSPLESLTHFREAIAALMSRSKKEIPHYYLETEMNLNTAMEWLDRRNEQRSVNERLLPIALLVKATAIAAKRIKSMNGSFVEGSFRETSEINIGFVISLRGGGIVSPCIRNADQLTVDQTMRTILDLISRARHGKLKSSEITGQTLTVSSLGDTGVDRVSGIIYPPQVAIIGFGRIKWRPWAEKNLVGAAQTVCVSLSADHRASDGLLGAQFLGEISKLLKDPANL